MGIVISYIRSRRLAYQERLRTIRVQEHLRQRELAQAAIAREAERQRALVQAAERKVAEARAREAKRQRQIALEAEQKAKAEEARANDVLTQLPGTKAFKKVTLKDASMAVHCVDAASHVIKEHSPHYMKQVDGIFDAFVKSMAKEHVATKMISVQGLNLKTGVIHGSEEALRADIEKQKEIDRLAKLDRESRYKKCVVCNVRNAYLNEDPPRGPWDVTHCVGCADPMVHLFHWVYPEGRGRRVRLENVRPHKYARAALV